MMLLRRLRIASLSYLTALLLFCSGASAAGHALHVGIQVEPPGLDPTINAAAAIGEVTYANLYQGLTRTAPDGTVRPLLASSWQVSADGRQYIFHLRRAVRFHNGVPFNAAVVKFALGRVMADSSANPQKPLLSALTGVTVRDSDTVELTLSRPDSDLPFVLSLPAMVMVEPQSCADNVRHPVGTGPFRFANWQRGATITLVRNEAYWGQPAPLSQAVFRFIADPSAASAALRAGDVDVFPDFPAPETVTAFRADKRFSVMVGTTEGEVLLVMNERRAPLGNLLVRRAISHALNRKAIIDGAYYGYGTPIGSHFAPQDAGYVDLTGRYPYDPARARALLAAAGYREGFALTLKLPPQPYARRSGEIVAAELSAIGIRVKIENIEWASWLSGVYRAHDYDLTVVAHVEPMDYGIYARDNYYFGYHSDRFNALLHQLHTTTALSARLPLLGALQRQLADDAANGFLFELPKLTVADARLSGFVPSGMVAANDLSTASFVRDGAGPASSVRGESDHRFIWPFVLAFLCAMSLWAGRGVGWHFLRRRLVHLLVTLVAASGIIFLALQVLPGDPATTMLGMEATPDTLAQLRHSLGFDAPLWLRYVRWVGGMLQGNFGTSYLYRVPVATLLADRVALSFPLAFLAFALSFLIALPLGLAASLNRGAARLCAVFTRIGLAVPDFWLAILLVLFFSVGLHWFSAGGFAGWEGGWYPALQTLLLPALALALPQAAITTRVLSVALSDAMAADYIRAARAKGAGRFSALVNHALPNAMIPVLTVLGLQFSFLLAGAVVVENVFYLPGLGRLVTEAVAGRDLIVVQDTVMLLVAATAIVFFIVDVAAALADPRLRGRGE